MPVVVAAGTNTRVVVVSRQAGIAVVATQAQAVGVAQTPPIVAVVSKVVAPLRVAAAGPQGAKGEAGGATVTRLAGQVLSALRVVCERDGAAWLLDPTSADDVALVLGLSLTAAATVGVQLDIQRIDAIESDAWSWTEGPVWAGPNGTLTQTEPTEGWELVVGWAASATRLVLSFDEPVQLT